LNGKIKVDEYVTHQRTLSTINDGFHDMHVSINPYRISTCYQSIGYIQGGDCIRCVVDMSL